MFRAHSKRGLTTVRCQRSGCQKSREMDWSFCSTRPGLTSCPGILTPNIADDSLQIQLQQRDSSHPHKVLAVSSESLTDRRISETEIKMDTEYDCHRWRAFVSSRFLLATLACCDQHALSRTSVKFAAAKSQRTPPP